jgi:hypothetical protein
VQQLQRFEPVVFHGRAYEDKVGALRFLTHRGFLEDFRQWEFDLDLAGFDLETWRSVEDHVRGQGITIVTPANTIFENTTSDSNTVFGPNSAEKAEATADRHKAQADVAGIGIHCGVGGGVCTGSPNARPDVDADLHLVRQSRLPPLYQRAKLQQTCVTEPRSFAWNHGDVQPDITTTWLGLAGPVSSS